MRVPARTVLAFSLFLLLSICGLNDFGLLSADEPRYAAIGKEMAASGDWVTPHLWGRPWFEKPPLLYWMIGAGQLAGLPGEWAARLPVALLSAGFLVVYWRLLREQAGERVAWMATAILGTCAGWMAFSRLAVTDLPLAAFSGMAMLLCVEWMRTANPRRLPWAGICFGAAILAKGPVPIALALPLAWATRAKWRQWWKVIVPALLVAAPWYVLCTARNGTPFLVEFFLKHNLGRFATSELQHGQQFWFYAPVLLGGLFPWTPLLVLLRRPANEWERFLWLWLGFGVLFFSIAVNKLPGYLLPLLPAAAALIAIGVDRARAIRLPLAASAALLGLVPLIAGIIPQAVVSGAMRALSGVHWTDALPWMVLFGVAVWALDRWKSRTVAFTAVTALACLAILYLLREASPALEQLVSARSRGVPTCIGNVNRTMRYGLNYYAGRELPDCVLPPR